MQEQKKKFAKKRKKRPTLTLPTLPTPPTLPTLSIGRENPFLASPPLLRPSRSRSRSPKNQFGTKESPITFGSDTENDWEKEEEEEEQKRKKRKRKHIPEDSPERSPERSPESSDETKIENKYAADLPKCLQDRGQVKLKTWQRRVGDAYLRNYFSQQQKGEQVTFPTGAGKTLGGLTAARCYLERMKEEGKERGKRFSL